MGLLLKPSSLVVNRDSKPSLPLKWRNPRTTQISLPSSMMIKNSTTISGFIPTIKCSSSSSSSSRGSGFRVQCVMKNSKKNCCFKKEEVKEEENSFIIEGKTLLKVLKALTTPVVSSKLVDILLTKYPALASSRTAIFFGVMVAYDLCRAIVSTRRIGDRCIQFSLGPVLGSIFAFVNALMAAFAGFGSIGAVTYEQGNENTITNKIIGYIVMFMGLFMMMLFGFGSATLEWPPRPEKGM